MGLVAIRSQILRLEQDQGTKQLQTYPRPFRKATTNIGGEMAQVHFQKMMAWVL
jgi:hypothetical protein